GAADGTRRYRPRPLLHAREAGCGPGHIGLCPPHWFRRRHADGGARGMRTFGQEPPPPSFMERLKAGLTKKGSLSDSLVGLFTRKKLDAATLHDLEEALIGADLGGAQAKAITAAIGKARYEADISGSELRDLLAQEIEKLLSPV